MFRLADALDLEMPELPEDEGVTRVSIVSAGSAHAFADAKVRKWSIKESSDSLDIQDMLASGIWEDEDARKFYEDLPDLQVLVPGVFLESNPPKKIETIDESKEEEETEQKPADNETPTEEKVNEEPPPATSTPPATDDNDEPDVDPSELMEDALK